MFEKAPFELDLNWDRVLGSQDSSSCTDQRVQLKDMKVSGLYRVFCKGMTSWNPLVR